jgi:hypothetical protein
MNQAAEPWRVGENRLMAAPARWVVGALVLGCVASASPPDAASKPALLHGKVLLLTEALRLRVPGVTVDPAPIADQVALVADDGVITPLLDDDASRALFVDRRLRNCRAELEGRSFTGVPYFQVISFKIERDGRLQTPEYYCDVCAISVLYPQSCPCCQGPMELRMKPDRR